MAEVTALNGSPRNLLVRTRLLYHLTLTILPPPTRGWTCAVDADGNEVEAPVPVMQAVSWRRIREMEGIGALMRGWNSRTIYQAAWRGGTLTCLEMMMYMGSNDSSYAVVGKALAGLAAMTLLAHPLDVVQSRIAAGCPGYSKVGVCGGVLRAMKDDTAYYGARASMLLALLSSPVRFGFLRSGPAAAAGLLLLLLLLLGCCCCFCCSCEHCGATCCWPACLVAMLLLTSCLSARDKFAFAKAAD